MFILICSESGDHENIVAVQTPDGFWYCYEVYEGNYYCDFLEKTHKIIKEKPVWSNSDFKDDWFVDILHETETMHTILYLFDGDPPHKI